MRIASQVGGGLVGYPRPSFIIVVVDVSVRTAVRPLWLEFLVQHPGSVTLGQLLGHSILFDV